MPLTGNSLNWWIGLLSESSDFAFARAWQAPPIYVARDILSSIIAGEIDLAGLSPARRQAIQGAASGLGFTEEALKPALFPSSAGRKPDLGRQFTAVPEVKPSSAIESLLTKVLRHSGLEALGGKPKLQFSSPLEGVTLAEAFVGGERVFSEEFSLLPTGESQAELLMNRGLIWRGPSGDVEKVLANRFTAAAKQASQTQNPDIAAAFHRALYPRGERSVSPQWVSPRGDIPPALATRLAMTRLKPDWVEGAAQWPDWNVELGGKLFAERDPSKRTAWHLASLAGAEGVAYSIRNYGATEDIGTRFSSEIIFSGMSGAGKYVKGAQRAGMQQYLLPSGVETFKGQMGHPVPDPWREYKPYIQPASTYAMAKVGFMGGMPEGAGVINPSLGPFRVPASFTKRIPLGTLDPSQVEILDQPQRVGRGKYIVANTPEGPFTVNQPQWDDVRFGDIGFGTKRGYPSLDIKMRLATSGSEGISWKGTGVKMFGALGDPRQVIPGEGELDIAAPWPSNPSATAEAWFQGLLHRGEAGRYGLADITTYTREAQARINQAFYAMAEQRMEMKWSPMPIAASVARSYTEEGISLRPHPEFEGKFQGQFPMLEFPEGLPITGLRKEWAGSRPTRVADRVMEYMFENMRPVAERLFASQAKTPYFNLFTAQMGGKVPDKQVVDLASLSSVDYARALGETEAGKEPTIEQHLAAIRSVTGGRFVRTAEGKLIPPTETAEYFWSRPQPGQPYLAGMRSYVGFFGSHFGSGAKAAGEALEGLTGQMEKTFSSPKFKRTLFSGFTPGGLYVPSTAWPSIELSEAAYMGTEDIMRLGSATGLSRRKILETSRAGELTSMVVRHPIPSKQLNLGNVLPVFPMGVGRAKGLPFESSRVPVLPVDVPVQGIGDVDADMYQFIQVARNYMNPDQRQKFQEFLSRMTGEERPDVMRAGQEEYNQAKTWVEKIRQWGSLGSALGELRKGLGIGSPITATQGDVQASFLEGMTGKQLMGTTYPWLLHQVGQVVPPEMEELFGVKAYTKALDATPFSEQLKSMFEINQTLNIVNKEGKMTGAMMNVLSPTTERAFGQQRFKAPGGTAPDWMGILSQVLGSGLIAPEIENQAMRLKALGLPENFQGDYFQAMETLGLRDPQSIQKYLATSPWGRLALLNPAGRAVRNLIGQGDLSLWESPFFEPEMQALGFAGNAAWQWNQLMSKRTQLGPAQMGEYIGGAMATGGRGSMLEALMGRTGTGFLRGGLPPSFASPPASPGQEFPAFISYGEASVLEGLRQMHPAHAQALAGQVGRAPRYTPSGQSLPSFQAGYEDPVLKYGMLRRKLAEQEALKKKAEQEALEKKAGQTTAAPEVEQPQAEEITYPADLPKAISLSGKDYVVPPWHKNIGWGGSLDPVGRAFMKASRGEPGYWEELKGGMGGEEFRMLSPEAIRSVGRAFRAASGDPGALRYQAGIPQALLPAVPHMGEGLQGQVYGVMSKMAYQQFEPLKATSDELTAAIGRVDNAMQKLTGTSEATREGIDTALAGYTGGKKGPLMNELRTAVGMRNLAARLDAGEIGPAEYALGEAGLMQERAQEQSRFQKFAKGGQIMTGLQWFYLSRMWGAFTEPVMQAAFTGAQATMGAYGAGLEAGVPMGGLDNPMMRAIGAQAMGQYRLGQAGQAAWGPVLEMAYGAKGRNAEAMAVLGPMAGMALTGGVLGGIFGGPAAPWAAPLGVGIGAAVGAGMGLWGMAETWKSDTAYRELKRYRQAEEYAAMAGGPGQGVTVGRALWQYGISGPSAEEITEIERGRMIEQAGVGLSYQDLMALSPEGRVQAVGENIANLQERYKLDEPTARRIAQWSMTEQRSDLTYGDIYAQQARLGIDRTQLQFGLAQAMRVPFRPGTAGFDRLLDISDQVKTSADLLRLQPAIAAAGGLYEPLAMAGRLDMLDFGSRIAGPPDEPRWRRGQFGDIAESPFGLPILQMQARAYQEAVLSGRKPEEIWPTQRLTGAGAPEYAGEVKKYSFGAQYVEPYARTIDRAYMAAGQESQYAALYERGKTMTVDQMTVQQLNVQQVQGQAAQLGAQFGGGTARALLNQAQFGTPAQALALAQAAGTTLGVMGVGEGLGINQGTMAEALRPFVSPAGGMQNFPGMLMSRVLSGGLQGDQADSALKFYNQAFFGGKTQYNQDVRLPSGASVPMGLDAFTMQWTVQQPQLQSRIEALQKDLTATGPYGLDTGERFVVESQIGSLQAMQQAPALSMRGGGESARAYRQRVLNLMFNTGIGMGNVQGLDPSLPLFGESLAGQSFWSLDKRQQDRAYAQGQYQFQYQDRQQAMSLSQFNQNWDLNRRQLDMNRRYQLEDFAFQDQMTALQRGFTQQQWGWQDRGTAMQRGFTQQQWGWQDEDIARQRTYQQQDRAWQLEERGQLNLGRGFQLETRLAQRAFSDETRGMQRRWQLEERGFEDADRGRHRLWQTEDLDEAIRFSTGRERKSLLRQRSRMNEDINAEDAGIDRARKQQDEMFKKEEAHLKKMRKLEDELWGLEEENYSRRFEREDELFQREELRFTTQTERDQATRAYQEEVWLLEDERNAATKAYQEEVWALEDARNEAMKARAEEQYNLAVERMDMEKAQFMERWGLQNEYNQKQLEFFEAQHEEQEIATQLQHTYFLLSQEGLQKLISSALDFKDAADLVRSAVTELLTAIGAAEWVGGGGGTPNIDALKGRADMGGNVWFGGVLGNISSGSFVPETKQTGYHGWAMPGDYMVLGGRKHTLAEQGPERLDVLPAHSRLFSPAGKGTVNLAGALDGMKLYVVIDGKQFNAHMKARERDSLYLEARR